MTTSRWLLLGGLLATTSCATTVQLENVHAVAPACVGTLMVDSTVYDTSQVASVPVLRQAPTWEYPRDLRDHGVTGRVAFTVVIGADGLPDSSSIVVDSATNAAFVAPARKSLVGTLFYPACRYGRPVRVRIQQAYAFMINGKGR